MTVISYEGENIIWFPEGLVEILRGKSIEEQLQYYYVCSERLWYSPVFYFARDCKEYFGHGLRHLTEEECKEILVKDDVVVGIVLPGWDVVRNCPEKRQVLPFGTMYSENYSDNNGAGFKESTSYERLVLLPPDFERKPAVAPPFSYHPDTCRFPAENYEGEKVTLPEAFVEQVRGKSVGEQLDYFIVQRRDSVGSDPMLVLREGSRYYDIYLSSDYYGDVLRYASHIEKVFVQDGLIVAVKYHSEWICKSTDDNGNVTGCQTVIEEEILKAGERRSSNGNRLAPVLYLETDR